MHIAFGRNYKDTKPLSREMTFEQFVRYVKERPRHHGKLSFAAYAAASKIDRGVDKDSAWFIPAKFIRPERRADAVECLSGFVCDFDDGAIGEAEIRDRLSAFRYVAWTSYSHGVSGVVRWRAFVPYARSIAPTEHKAVYEHFNQIFEGHLDPRCATVSQLWYLPGSPVDGPDPRLISGDDEAWFVPEQSAREVRAAAPGGGGLASQFSLAAVAEAAAEIKGRQTVSLKDLVSAPAALDKTVYEDYSEWLKIGMAIYDATQGSPEGLKIFDRWSRLCPGYTPGTCEAKWTTFGGHGNLPRITAASIFKQARDRGWEGATDIVHPHDPKPDVPPAPAPEVSLAPGTESAPAHSADPGVPVQLVLPLIVPVPMPANYRNDPKGWGLQKLVEDDAGENLRWETKVRGLRVMSLDYLKNISNGSHTLELICMNPSGPADAQLDADTMADNSTFHGLLMDRGILCNADEFKVLRELIMEWLKKIQEQQRVKHSFTTLGWMEQGPQIMGFAHGETAFFADGRSETGIKVTSGGGSTIAKHYLPQGDLATWKCVSSFLASQGRQELMAILSTAFGSPLMRFSGHSGAVVSIVSNASGVGKSTVLSTAQSVWGNPKKTVHAATDTVLSLSSKMGFTKDLPAYWDDIKGHKTFEQFAAQIYQITQGKEKSRLTQHAQLREVETWNCLAVVAANDSIIEIVRQVGMETDAGAARVFEIRLEKRPDNTQAPQFFSQVEQHYGRAGEVYGRWLAANHATAKGLVEAFGKRLSLQLEPTAEERFWIAALSTMMAGAKIATDLDLVKFDLKALWGYLTQRFLELRSGKAAAVSQHTPTHAIGDLLGDHMQTTLKIDRIPRHNSGKPIVVRAPQARQVDVTIAQDPGVARIRVATFNKWCKMHGHSSGNLKRQLEELGAITERNVDLAGGTAGYSVGRSFCYDIDIAKLGIEGDTDGDGEDAGA